MSDDTKLRQATALPLNVDNIGIVKGTQDRVLSKFCREKVPACIYLVNGVKLYGTIQSFDQYVIYFHAPIRQIIYKHAICSVLQIDAFDLAEKIAEGFHNSNVKISPTKKHNIRTHRRLF
jgi:RNA chaperone Hfq